MTILERPSVQYRVDNCDVAVITLDRPEVRNAIGAAITKDLADAIDRALCDGRVGAIVLAGNGLGFCAGMDLREIDTDHNATVVALPERSEWGFAGFAARPIEKPVIAAVHGIAAGGGAEIALACDVVVADETAVFAFPEVSLGLIAAGGGLLRAPAAMPEKVAMELLLTGRHFSAEEARLWGIVSRVVSRGHHVETAISLAHEIAANAPTAVRTTKRVVQATRGASSSDRAPWSEVEMAWRDVIATGEYLEGVRAFIQKRTPRWRTMPGNEAPESG